MKMTFYSDKSRDLDLSFPDTNIFYRVNVNLAGAGIIHEDIESRIKVPDSSSF